ncbi:enoyl-CoA hydratase/isomerase family protein [Sphingomonas sp. SCN 67-18]|uniref:enoyl-CoA hydratase/isomerase family protein n=1 Tax=uncultured Sphingomonas sp. TaxID=158754 RepID=UPI0025EE4756|nr:enoyl-CoA hydratase/isomerase family protein [Sphingomonas sp. SCN 67-18]
MTARPAQGMSGAMFDLLVTDRIARLSLARPEARNALRVADWRALPGLVAQAVDAGARAIVLQSAAEGMFCAGADLGELAGLGADAAARQPFRTAMRAALDAVRASPAPVIAAVDGGCFGAGVALAMACDIRIAGPRALFAVTPAKLGIGYPLEDIARLHALVGVGQAARMLFGAVTLDAAEAARIGLAEVVADEVAQAADALAAAMAGNSPASLALLKQGLALAAGGIASDAGHDAAFDAAFGAADFAEGIAAFRARRRPEFQG